MTREGFWAGFWAWVDRPVVSPRDLAVFRIVYAVLTLALLPTVRFAAGLPPTAFDPPLGPLSLLPSAPPDGVVIALEVTAALALALLAIGWRTPVVSVVAGLTLLAVTGLSNSFGQVDHVALFGVVPLLLAASGWGNTFSLDATASRVTTSRPWTLRLLALAIGLSFLVAGVTKIAGGWLNPDTQSAYGHLLRRLLTNENSGLLGNVVGAIQTRYVWEPADWSTVGLELLLIFTVLSWRSFRIGISFAALFHGLVLLTFGIEFPSAIIAYGAFLPWSRLLPKNQGARPSVAIPAPLMVGAAALAAVAAWTLAASAPAAQSVVAAAVVSIGALIGAAALVVTAARGIRWVRGWDATARSRAGTWAGRLVALALILVLPVQYWLMSKVGEPYPALQQPGFSQPRLADGLLRANNVPRIKITFDDGSIEYVESSTVLRSPQLQQSAVFRNVFGSKERARRPEVVAWLESRLAELFPGRVAVKFRVGWTTVMRDADDGHIVSEDERYDVVVDLGRNR